jgi:hypothetical protein
MTQAAKFVHRVEGLKATRVSPRVYLFATVAKFDTTAYRAAVLKQAEHSARRDYPYIVGEANPTTRQFSHDADCLARYVAIAAGTVEQYVVAEQARVAAQLGESNDDGGERVVSWHMSIGAAQKSPTHNSFLYDVRIAPVVRSAK